MENKYLKLLSKKLKELSFYKNLKSANDINPFEYDVSYSLVSKIIEL